jgi:hypothetical protein
VGFFWCCCGGGETGFSITLTVSGCSAVQSDASVQYKVGATVVASGTTNNSGQLSVSLPAGTYTRIVSKSRFATSSNSVVITEAGSQNVTLNAATGYACCNNCPQPIPTTLYLRTGLKTVTLTRSGSIWIGSTTYSVTGWDANPPGCNFILGSTSVEVSFELHCPSSGTNEWQVIASAGAFGGTVDPDNYATASAIALAPCINGYECFVGSVGEAVAFESSCDIPLSLSESFSGTWTGATIAEIPACPNPTAISLTALDSGSFTIAES